MNNLNNDNNMENDKKSMYSTLSINLSTKEDISSMVNVFTQFINDLTYEDAKDLLKRAKLYPEYKDMDENKVRDALKVAIKYTCILIKEANNVKFNGAACDKEEDYSFYRQQEKYYEQAMEELNSEEFNYTKLMIILNLEKAMYTHEALSSCKSLEVINDYLKKNIINIVKRKTHHNLQKAEYKKTTYLKYKR